MKPTRKLKYYRRKIKTKRQNLMDSFLETHHEQSGCRSESIWREDN